MTDKDKKESGLSLVANGAAKNADNDNVAAIFKSHLQSSGVISFFGQLVLSGFSVRYAAPEKPGLHIVIEKPVMGGAPMHFNIILTEHDERGHNQPVIRTIRDDRPGEVIELYQIKEIREYVGYWIVDNLPRVTSSPGHMPLVRNDLSPTNQ